MNAGSIYRQLHTGFTRYKQKCNNFGYLSIEVRSKGNDTHITQLDLLSVTKEFFSHTIFEQPLQNFSNCCKIINTCLKLQPISCFHACKKRSKSALQYVGFKQRLTLNDRSPLSPPPPGPPVIP